MQKKFKYVGAVIVLLLAFALLYLNPTLRLNPEESGPLTLQMLWEEDLAQIQSSIPQWSSLKSYEFSAGDDLAKNWIQVLKPPIPTQTNGIYKIELHLMLQDPPHPTHAVIQHHVVHIPSGNSVLEISRTYQIVP